MAFHKHSSGSMMKFQMLQPPRLESHPVKEMTQRRRLSGDVAVFEMDEYGFITSWSIKAEQIYGYEAQDIIGKHIASLYSSADLIHGKAVNELRATESRSNYFAFGWQKRLNGQEFWTYSECQALRNKKGELLGFRKYVVETSAAAS